MCCACHAALPPVLPHNAGLLCFSVLLALPRLQDVPAGSTGFPAPAATADGDFDPALLNLLAQVLGTDDASMGMASSPAGLPGLSQEAEAASMGAMGGDVLLGDLAAAAGTRGLFEMGPPGDFSPLELKLDVCSGLVQSTPDPRKRGSRGDELEVRLVGRQPCDWAAIVIGQPLQAAAHACLDHNQLPDARLLCSLHVQLAAVP